jgi:STE24 endopeptidase
LADRQITTAVSRILLLVLFLVWLAWPGDQQWSIAQQWPWLLLFIGFYVLLVILLGLWSRVLARRSDSANFHQNVRRFNYTMFAARIIVPAWFAVGVWKLGWGPLIAGGIGNNLAGRLPGVLLGTFPAFAAWMGLWWSQYPADRAVREQSFWSDWENQLPLHQPPPFRSYFAMNLRLQVLFTIVPVLLWVAMRDVISVSSTHYFHWTEDRLQQRVDLAASAIAAAVVFLLVPKILRRVLNTVPLPSSPLRSRLEQLCRRAKVRYCDILLWQTQNNIGNAAVMGILPRMRYFLISDVLMERMTDDQIEAVFAHELGHIVHRHMGWYAVFLIVLIVLMMATATALAEAFPMINQSHAGIALMMMLGTAMFLLLFGALSRSCERQADVYAARIMEAIKGPAASSEALLNPRQLSTVAAGSVQKVRPNVQWVGPYGAALFSSALEHVAVINNIPIGSHATPSTRGRFRPAHLFDSLVDMANHWFHGSIASRMTYLQRLGAQPRLTARFDRAMFALYGTLIFGLVIACVLWWAMGFW